MRAAASAGFKLWRQVRDGCWSGGLTGQSLVGRVKEGNGNFDNEKDDGIAELTSSMVSDGAHLCECTAEEALGLSIAVDGGTVYVERAVWEACALPPAYNTQRGKMRLEVMPKSDRLDLERAFKLEAADAERQKARPPAPLPWEITSADELINLDLTDKALSAMRAGMRLPRAREATDEKLTRCYSPFSTRMSGES